jgi:hypothetical protein
LAAAQEAVSIRRALADARPKVFTPNLALSPWEHFLANTLSQLGRHEEALAAAELVAAQINGVCESQGFCIAERDPRIQWVS